MSDNSRRQFLLALSLIGPATLVSQRLFGQATGAGIELASYPSAWLPAGMRSRFVNDVNGLRIHVLEAGYETPGRPALLLLHGFPELAYSWRRVMQPLAEAGYHVIAPDVRGYGRTTGWSSTYDTDLTPFRTLNKVRDAMVAFCFMIRPLHLQDGVDGGWFAGGCRLRHTQYPKTEEPPCRVST